MNLFGGLFRSRDYPAPTQRHWKCKLGFHLWGRFYIRPMSSSMPWRGHARDCQRAGCDRHIFHVFPPDNVDAVGYRHEDRT